MTRLATKLAVQTGATVFSLAPLEELVNPRPHSRVTCPVYSEDNLPRLTDSSSYESSDSDEKYDDPPR